MRQPVGFGDELSGTRLPRLAQQFIWNRCLQLNWNPTCSLQLAFNSGTDARIEEPHVQVTPPAPARCGWGVAVTRRAKYP